MALRTMVGILQADTGELLGSGSLVLPDAVLVHSPLSARFVREHADRADGAPTGLRVCITTWSGSTVDSEMVDVADVVVSARAARGTRRRIAGLALATPSSAACLPALDRDEELARHLVAPLDAAELPDRKPRPLGPGPDTDHPLCTLAKIFCRTRPEP